MEDQVFELKGIENFPPLPYVDYSQHESDIIIIELGSYATKIGFSEMNEPAVFRTAVLHKTQNSSTVVPTLTEQTLVGSEIPDQELLKSKNPMDKNIIVNSKCLEEILDYSFQNLNIQGNCVNHPILMSECVNNPGFSRELVSSLLFDCYGVPAINFYMPALFTTQKNNTIIIDVGYQTTHIMPVVDGNLQYDGVQRLNLGSFQAQDHLLKVLQLKHPLLVKSVTPIAVQELFHKYCYITSKI